MQIFLYYLIFFWLMIIFWTSILCWFFFLYVTWLYDDVFCLFFLIAKTYTYIILKFIIMVLLWFNYGGELNKAANSSMILIPMFQNVYSYFFSVDMAYLFCQGNYSVDRYTLSIAEFVTKGLPLAVCNPFNTVLQICRELIVMVMLNFVIFVYWQK